MINLFVISSIFLLMKEVLLKKIVIVVGKLTRSRVLQGETEIHRPQTAGMGQENFSCYAGRGRDGVRLNLAGWGRRPHPSDPPRPIAILNVNHSKVTIESIFFFFLNL